MGGFNRTCVRPHSIAYNLITQQATFARTVSFGENKSNIHSDFNVLKWQSELFDNCVKSLTI